MQREMRIPSGPKKASFLQEQGNTGKCKDGDVRIRPRTKFGPGIPLWPEVFHAGKFYPICGHYFWDSDDGAATVCKMLGFSGGKRKYDVHVHLPDGPMLNKEDLMHKANAKAIVLARRAVFVCPFF